MYGTKAAAATETAMARAVTNRRALLQEEVSRAITVQLRLRVEMSSASRPGPRAAPEGASVAVSGEHAAAE